MWTEMERIFDEDNDEPALCPFNCPDCDRKIHLMVDEYGTTTGVTHMQPKLFCMLGSLFVQGTRSEFVRAWNKKVNG